MPKLKGKPPDFRMGPEHRLKIANSNVLKCLIDHACGEREMSSTQVTAGLGLLKKVMPDLAHNENEHKLEAGESLLDFFSTIVDNGKRVGSKPK